MELVTFLIDFILHVDKYLEAFVQTYGMWVYALLFAIVFVETGLVVMPFLPGDSLLFIVGALCGAGLMNFPLACGVLLAAAILGVVSAILGFNPVSGAINFITTPIRSGWASRLKKIRLSGPF